MIEPRSVYHGFFCSYDSACSPNMAAGWRHCSFLASSGEARAEQGEGHIGLSRPVAGCVHRSFRQHRQSKRGVGGREGRESGGRSLQRRRRQIFRARGLLWRRPRPLLDPVIYPGGEMAHVAGGMSVGHSGSYFCQNRKHGFFCRSAPVYMYIFQRIELRFLV